MPVWCEESERTHKRRRGQADGRRASQGEQPGRLQVLTGVS